MKFDLHGIRFRLWAVCFLLTLGITVFIGTLQTGLIRPYYRNSKVQAVRQVADAIESNLITAEADSTSVSDALQEIVNNNACAVILNASGRMIYSADSLGAGCVLNDRANAETVQIMTAEYMNEAADENGEYSLNISSDLTNQEMIVYGKVIRRELATYYLYVNSPLEPIDSVVSFFSRQYALYTVIAIIFASIVAFYISKRVSDPIVTMNKEAGKLAAADYSAEFEGGTFTETEQLAETLNTANRKLSQIDELRRDLIANVSHDIRTPLTDIRAYAEMIRDISGDNPEKRNKHLGVIIRETEYMNRLVQDMSELSKMQSGNYILNCENMDLCESIREILEMDEIMIDEAGLKVETELPDYLTVYADKLKIEQVIANYLSNAIKHTPEGKTIYVRAWVKEDEETVHFEVQDEGEGIPADELPNIWDRYQKASSSFSRSQTSTGLGLSIVKAIADIHNAAYGVSSTEGEGSTFWLELKKTNES